MRKIIAQPNTTLHQARFLGLLAFSVLQAHHAALGAQTVLNLGTAGNYVILSETGITTVPPAAVTGDMAVSPIDSTAITGFSLIMDSSGQFSTSSQVTGKVYAPNYATPTPANLTTAVSDMETAYTAAAGRTLPDYTELGSGNIGGMTLSPGLYKWSTDVSIPTDVTLSGGPSAVWIFQIAGNLDISGAASVLLNGGAQPQNIFWQVAGGTGANLATTSQFSGTILAQAAINMQTGASINGRLLAQTAVTLDANTITIAPVMGLLSFGPTLRAANGTVTLSITNTPGLALTLQTSTNLISWTTLTTLTPTNTPYMLIDTMESADSVLYYRAFYP